MNLKSTQRLIFFFLIYLIIIPENLHCQETPDSLAFRYYEKASAFSKEDKYDSSLYYLDKSASLFLASGLKNNYAEVLLKKAYVLSYQNLIDSSEYFLENAIDLSHDLGKDSSMILVGAYSLKARFYSHASDYKSAIEYMKLALQRSLEYFGDIHYKTSDAHGNLGITYSSAGQYRKAIYHCNKSAEIIRELYGDDHPSIANGYNTIGNIYIDLGKLDSAQIMHEKALAIRLKAFGRNHLYTAASYSNLSVVSYYKDDFQKALNYEKSVYAIRLEIYDENHPAIAMCYNNFGAIYEVMGLYEESLENHLQALKIRQLSLPPNHPDLAMSYMNLANTYNHFEEYDKALEYHQKSLQIKRNLYGDFHPDIAMTINNMGHTYQLKEDFDSARLKFSEAIFNLRNAYPDYIHPSIIGYENNLTDSYISLNKIDSALKHIESAIDINIRIIDHEGAKPDTVFLDQMEFLRSLSLRAMAWFLDYSSNGSALSSLSKSIKDYSSAIEFYLDMRNSFEEEVSQEILSINTNELFNDALNTMYTYYTKTNDDALIEKMFYISERGKNDILRSLMTQQNALKLSNITDNTAKQLNELASSIKSLKIEISEMEETLNKTNAEEAKLSYQKLFKLEEEYDSLLLFIKNTYPRYNQLVNERNLPTLKQVSEALDEKTLILSYTIADTSLFIQVIKNNNTAILRHTIDTSFTKSIMEYLKGIKSFDIENCLDRSRTLYSELIEPVEEYIESMEKIVIIPHQELLYLPFETLCNSSERPEEENFSNAPYLIRKHVISYNYSASMFFQKSKITDRVQLQDEFLGFAPVFSSDSTNGLICEKNKIILDTLSNDELALRAISVDGKTFNELPFSEMEVQEVVDLFNNSDYSAKGLYHSMASEEQFRALAADYKYIHISTHGLLNESHPELSGLIFSQPQVSGDSTETSPGSSQDGILHAFEIFELNLNTDLVVLSACETGVGKLIKGEGLVSMTRGFLYAGVPNIMISLWKVGDKSTRELMVRYYSNMIQGDKYSEALREAKLHLIENEKYAYPFYWGGFTLIGIE